MQLELPAVSYNPDPGRARCAAHSKLNVSSKAEFSSRRALASAVCWGLWWLSLAPAAARHMQTVLVEEVQRQFEVFGVWLGRIKTEAPWLAAHRSPGCLGEGSLERWPTG